MGKRGPRPVPTAILARRGSWRAKLRKNEPNPSGPVGDPPDWLSPEAKEIWEVIVERVKNLDLLTCVDREPFARYCSMLAQWRKLYEETKDLSPVYPLHNEDGSVRYLQERPEISLMKRLDKQLLALEKEFGFTPSARANLGIKRNEPTDEKAIFKIV